MRSLTQRQPQTEFSRMMIFHGGDGTAPLIIPATPNKYLEINQIIAMADTQASTLEYELRIQLGPLAYWRLTLSTNFSGGNIFTYPVPLRTPVLTDDLFVAGSLLEAGNDYTLIVLGTLVGINDFGAAVIPPITN